VISFNAWPRPRASALILAALSAVIFAPPATAARIKTDSCSRTHSICVNRCETRFANEPGRIEKCTRGTCQYALGHCQAGHTGKPDKKDDAKSDPKHDPKNPRNPKDAGDRPIPKSPKTGDSRPPRHPEDGRTPKSPKAGSHPSGVPKHVDRDPRKSIPIGGTRRGGEPRLFQARAQFQGQGFTSRRAAFTSHGGLGGGSRGGRR
jgi:hypothetical protein